MAPGAGAGAPGAGAGAAGGGGAVLGDEWWSTFLNFFIQVHLGGIVMGWGVVVTAASLDIKKICHGVFFSINDHHPSFIFHQ